jgi:hypothetical protein
VGDFADGKRGAQCDERSVSRDGVPLDSAEGSLATSGDDDFCVRDERGILAILHDLPLASRDDALSGRRCHPDGLFSRAGNAHLAGDARAADGDMGGASCPPGTVSKPPRGCSLALSGLALCFRHGRARLFDALPSQGLTQGWVGANIA